MLAWAGPKYVRKSYEMPILCDNTAIDKIL